MGLEIEIESGEGTLEITSGEEGGEEKNAKIQDGDGSPRKSIEGDLKSDGEEEDDEDFEEVEADADDDTLYVQSHSAPAVDCGLPAINTSGKCEQCDGLRSSVSMFVYLCS